MPGKSDSSDRTDQPDWLDELYQRGDGDEPGPELDDRIRSAARDAVRNPGRATPWYLRARTLASAATIVLAAGVVMMWSGNPELQRAAEPSQTAVPLQAPAAAEEALSPSPPATEPPGRPNAAAKTRLVAKKEEAVTAEADNAELSGIMEELETARRQVQYASDQLADASSAMRVNSDAPAAGAFADSSAREARAASPSYLTRERPEIALPSGLLSQQCESAVLIDVGARAPYGMCRQPEQTSIHHADCPEPYLLDEETVTLDRDSRSLLLTSGAESWQLICTGDSWQRTQLMPESNSEEESPDTETAAPSLEQ